MYKVFWFWYQTGESNFESAIFRPSVAPSISVIQAHKNIKYIAVFFLTDSVHTHTDTHTSPQLEH